jgi:hypothetical protein
MFYNLELCNFDNEIQEIDDEIEHLKNMDNDTIKNEEIDDKSHETVETRRKFLLDRDWDKPKLSKLILI